MSETTITQLPDPSGFSADPFTDVIRDGARKLIEQAIHAEMATLMAAFSNEKLEDGRARLVRHGHLPEREVMSRRDMRPSFTRPDCLRKSDAVALPRVILTVIPTSKSVEKIESDFHQIGNSKRVRSFSRWYKMARQIWAMLTKNED